MSHDSVCLRIAVHVARNAPETCHVSDLLCCVTCCAGVRLDWVTAGLEVLLPHSSSAAVQCSATPLLQSYGFVLQPSSIATTTGTSSCCSSSQAAAAAPPSVAAAGAAAPRSSSAEAEEQPASSSYDDLIKASSNPAALLGRLLENAPNLARAPSSSSRSSVGLPLGLSPMASPIRQSRFKPVSHQQQQGPGQLPAQASIPQQQDVLIDVARLLQKPPAATAAAGAAAGPVAASSSSAGAGAGGPAGPAVAAEGVPGVGEAVTESYKFSIEGMSCGSCVKSVESAVGQVGALCWLSLLELEEHAQQAVF